jgi:thiosulfate/3-mercaptopyruvate sulfurtransferase
MRAQNSILSRNSARVFVRFCGRPLVRRAASLTSLLCIVGSAGVLLQPTDIAAVQAAKSSPASDPWSARQTITPGALAKELADTGGPQRPIVVCAGFRPLFEGAHIPGATFHGPGAKPAGLADLRKWAETLPHSANIVVYCGCCPLSYCPNLRPAFVVLRDMGFTRVRVLLIPKNLASDWIQAGYPIAKGG